MFDFSENSLKINLIIGILGSLIASFLVYILYKFRNSSMIVYSKVVRLLRKDIKQHDTWPLEKIYKQIEEAKKRVYILQTWFPKWEREHNAWKKLMKSLNQSNENNSFEMKVLLADPSLYQARLRARCDSVSGQIDMFTEYRKKQLEVFINQNQNDNCQIDIALYNSLPFGPIYCIDDKLFWGRFVSGKDSMDSICFETKVDSNIGFETLESFDEAWKTRSSEIHPSMNNTTLVKFRKAITDKFNSLRNDLQKYKLLGMYRPSKSNQIDYSELNKALKICKDKAVRTVAIMRHAETALNGVDIFSGLLALRISDNGEKQAKDLQRRIRNISRDWTKVKCSTLFRTRDTLRQILDTTSSISPCRELDERNIGEMEGSSKPSKSSACWGFFYEPPLGESYARLFTKMHEYDFITKIFPINPPSDDQENVLLCAHEGPIKIIRMLLESDRDFSVSEMDIIKQIDVEPCSLFIYIREDMLPNDSIQKNCIEQCMCKASKNELNVRMISDSLK